MIPTLRRSRDDVFLIGEESLLLAQDEVAGSDPDPTIAIRDLGGDPSRRTRSPHLPAALHGARGMALLGLAVGASALVALRPWGGGAPERPAHTVSPRSPLISRSAAALPTGRSTGHQHPFARPAEVHRPDVVHHERHRRPKASASPRPEITGAEPEREPTPYVAPESSPPVTPTTAATPGPTAPAEPAADPTPPSPPPSSSGGGPGGVGDPQAHPGASRTEADTFGFER